MPQAASGYVQVSDGEAVASGDFNNAQLYARAQLLDQFLGGLARNAATGGASTSFCYALGAGGRLHQVNSHTLAHDAGLIMQKVSSSALDGKTWNFLSYYLSANEIATSVPAAPAVNPRMDSLFVRLSLVDGPLVTRDFQDAATAAKSSQSFATAKQVKLETQFVSGTENANANYPYQIGSVFPAAPDATWVRLFSFYQKADGTITCLDHRFPINYKETKISLATVAGSAMTRSGDGSLVATATPQACYIPLPVTGSGRILKAGFNTVVSAGNPSAQFFSHVFSWIGSVAVTDTAIDFSTFFISVPATQVISSYYVASDINVPIWGNGQYTAGDVADIGELLLKATLATTGDTLFSAGVAVAQ